jgi:hypothetical protein
MGTPWSWRFLPSPPPHTRWWWAVSSCFGGDHGGRGWLFLSTCWLAGEVSTNAVTSEARASSSGRVASVLFSRQVYSFEFDGLYVWVIWSFGPISLFLGLTPVQYAITKLAIDSLGQVTNHDRPTSDPVGVQADQ